MISNFKNGKRKNTWACHWPKTKWRLRGMHVGCSQSQRNNTKNVDCFESKNRDHLMPVLTGNQTPCRSLPRYLISRSGNYELKWVSLVSIQNKSKCLKGVNVDHFVAERKETSVPVSDWKSDSLSLTSAPRVRQGRERLLWVLGS